MTQSTLNVFEHTIEITHTWLNDLLERLAWRDHQRAYRALRAVLHALMVRSRACVRQLRGISRTSRQSGSLWPCRFQSHLQSFWSQRSPIR
jgi:hypothetical protein